MAIDIKVKITIKIDLMPKLGLLSVARGTEHESRIPVIDSYSESFNSQLKDIMITAKFWVHCFFT